MAFKTVTVKLWNKTQIGTDIFDEPINKPSKVDVAGCLVYPSTPEAVVSDLQIYGKRSVYEICIPKGDTHSWEDKIVEFFGKKFRTFTPVIEYIDGNVPLKWNKKVRCEKYE